MAAPTTLKRFSSKRPGHDCIRHPCGRNGCGTNPGSGHGIADETWQYAVSDGVVALSLTVGSGSYPESVPPRCLPDEIKVPTGRWLHVHAAFPTDREDVARGKLGSECEYVDSGRCFDAHMSALDADNLYRVCGGKSFEQSEGFWEGMEAAWRVRAQPHYERRADDYLRCPHCDGTGAVRKQPP